MSALELLRELTERGEEHGIRRRPIPLGALRKVDQLGESPCWLRGGCGYACPIVDGHAICWAAVSAR